jgi:hypothetical protein
MTRWLLALSWWWHTWKAPVNRVSVSWLSEHCRERRDVE